MMNPYQFSMREKMVAAERWAKETFRLSKSVIESVDSYGFRYSVGEDNPRVVTWRGAVNGDLGI